VNVNIKIGSTLPLWQHRRIVSEKIQETRVTQKVTQRDGVDTSKFQMFLTTLIPLMPDGAFLILDNTRWHKAEFVVNLLRLAKVEWLWLSPFSPEYNPPIHLFRWLKRRCRASKYDDTPQAIREGLSEVSNENLQSFIKQ
jgi:hypothetical protein